MNEIELELELQEKGLNAPRITPQHIESVISNVSYFTAYNAIGELAPHLIHSEPLKLLTFCVIVLKNGFTVTGESACASPENFDADIGREIAYENAKNKIWMLEGYLLKEKLYNAK